MEGNRVSRDKWRKIGLVKASKEVEKGRKMEDRREKRKETKSDGCNAVSSSS